MEEENEGASLIYIRITSVKQYPDEEESRGAHEHVGKLNNFSYYAPLGSRLISTFENTDDNKFIS